MVARPLIFLLLAALGGCSSSVAPPPVAVHRTPIISNLKQAMVGLQIYQADHNENSPPLFWRESLEPYTKNPDVFENRRSDAPFIFAHRAALIGKSMAKVDVPAETAILFDVAEACDPYLAELPALFYRPREKGAPPVALIAFVDGHATHLPKGSPGVR